MSEHSSASKLGWFLCWAVVFADIGTSLYYVPGILYGDVSKLAGLFVLMSSVVFVLLVIKYIDITARYPEGGGVVTVATHAFNPWVGALGGMFITVDYFLTASISSVSGFAYLNSVVHLGGFVIYAAILGVMALGVLNVIGIKESAKVTAVVAIAAFIIDIILVAFVATQVGSDGWKTIFDSLGEAKNLAPVSILTGFAGSFLAFSGLESISQLSPAMQTPRRKIATIAMVLVVFSIMLTSPFLTLFSTNLLSEKVPGSEETILEAIDKKEEREEEIEALEAKSSLTEEEKVELEALEKQVKDAEVYSERFMSELGAQYGGDLLKIAVVATASVLLLFASNTAIIGAYHVFITLSRQRFLPKVIEAHNSKFGSPHWAVLLAVLPPVVIIFATQGNLSLLGQLYAFGLLGAFALSSIGLDIVRWRENPKVNLNFVIGIITSILVVIAWGTNLINKPLATGFGGGITILGMILAFVVNKYTKPEELIQHAIEKVKEVTKGQIFVPVFDEFDKNLFDFVGDYAQKQNKSVVLMYVRQFADVFQTVSESIEKDTEASKYMKKGLDILGKYDVKVSELYKASADTAAVINETRAKIDPSITILSPHKRSALLDFLRGDVVKDVMSHKNGNVLIYTGGK